MSGQADIAAAVLAEREACAVLAAEGHQAPTDPDGGGFCVECRFWTPAWHPDRGDHGDSCKAGASEFPRSPGAARAIRSRPPPAGADAFEKALRACAEAAYARAHGDGPVSEGCIRHAVDAGRKAAKRPAGAAVPDGPPCPACALPGRERVKKVMASWELTQAEMDAIDKGTAAPRRRECPACTYVFPPDAKEAADGR